MARRKKSPVTYAFVDASNIIYRPTDKDFWKIDVKKLLLYLKHRFGVSRVFYYGGVDENDTVQTRLYRNFEKWGYELRLNPIKRFTNERGERYTKADVDSRMTFEMMRYKDEYDRVLVLTGDGDFLWVLEYLMKEKKKAMWLLSSPTKTAKELRKLFGYRFINFDDTRRWIEYQPKK